MAQGKLKISCDLDDTYFQRHFARLVDKHGGKWVVLAEGRLIGIGEGGDVARLIRKARKKFPRSIPFASPIPSREDLECLL